MKTVLIGFFMATAAFAGSAGSDMINDPNGEPQKIKKTAKDATESSNEFFGAMRKRVKKSTDEISKKVKTNTEAGSKNKSSDSH